MDKPELGSTLLTDRQYNAHSQFVKKNLVSVAEKICTCGGLFHFDYRGPLSAPGLKKQILIKGTGKLSLVEEQFQT